MNHTGCLGSGCPICPIISRPGYDRVRAHLQASIGPAGAAILVTGGIGDIFAIEGMLPVELRERLETVYIACPAAEEIELLWDALAMTPQYPRLHAVEVLRTGRRSHYSLASVSAAVGIALPEGVEDWSILAAFPRRLPYTGSTFLLRELARPAHRPPSPYVVIVPGSSWGRWEGRDFDAQDWATTLALLDRERLYGVLLRRERNGVPHHPRLLDRSGQTSILATIELLKGAVGYVGIDSALSVLAAKLFPSGRLIVKSVWHHCYANAESYFSPRKEFPFLRKQVEVSHWI